MKYKDIITLPLLVITIFCQLVGEDYGPIGTSRPGAANPTSSVPTGLYQFEMGTNLETSPGRDTTFTIPTLLRMGIYKNVELQVAYASKYLTLALLYGGIGVIKGLENSIILTTSLTENNDDLTEYSTFFPISYSFQDGFSIWGQLAGTFFNNKEIDPIINYSLAVGNSFNNKTSWFFEAYQSRFMKQSKNINDPPFSIDYGITYLSDNNIQFDLSMGLTFEKDDADYIETLRFLEWGFSFRLPK